MFPFSTQSTMHTSTALIDAPFHSMVSTTIGAFNYMPFPCHSAQNDYRLWAHSNAKLYVGAPLPPFPRQRGREKHLLLAHATITGRISP